ncbi:hypothetical protein, conserved [Eimeria praecox]|uniref:PPM-type phosphatase domain-containing protein n=1 Tax=Eimeria praecox TaxID=51316 RepID=U6G2X2_9EIME|nr:hypothetical protein, conserved [Eimeria praecox]
MVPRGLSGGPASQPRRPWGLLLLFLLAVQTFGGRAAEQDLHNVSSKTPRDYSDQLSRQREQAHEQHVTEQGQLDFEPQGQQEDTEGRQQQEVGQEEYREEGSQLVEGEEGQQQQRQERQRQKGMGVSFKLFATLKGTDSESLATATMQLKGLLETLDSNRKIEKQQQGMADTIQRALKARKPSSPTPNSGSAGGSGAQGPANHLRRKTMKLHLGFAETAAATVIGRRADDEDVGLYFSLFPWSLWIDWGRLGLVRMGMETESAVHSCGFHVCAFQALLLSAPLPGKPSSFITGLFDGHGGHVVARKCSVLTPTFFGRMPDFSGNSLAEASFALDAALRSDPEIPIGPGSTGIIGILVADDPSIPEFTLHVANVGDSRLLVLHPNGTFTPMSVDQKPNDPLEMARVQRAGGSVMRTAMGVWRIDGRLALSRSFGDFRMKGRSDLLPSQQKVVALPHSRTIKVKAGDILVFACDGVFEAQGMTWKFVANFVAIQLKASGSGLWATEGNLEETASRLITTAYLMGSGDNISAMIIRIHPTAYPESAVSAAEVDIMGVRKELPVMLPSEATVQRSGAWVTDLGLYATLY